MIAIDDLKITRIELGDPFEVGLHRRIDDFPVAPPRLERHRFHGVRLRIDYDDPGVDVRR